MQQLTQAILTQVIHPRIQSTHKGDFGRVLIIGGNENFGGAAIMAAKASVNAGAGLTTVATDKINVGALHAQVPEAMFVDDHDIATIRSQLSSADAIVMGPGLGESQFSRKLLAITLEWLTTNGKATQTLVIDGSAITILATQRTLLTHLPVAMNIIFTPHQMEWQRLAELPIAKQTPTANQAAQQKLHANVIVKKHHTELYLVDDSVWQLSIGSAAMATGGMGDTLTGIIAAFCAQFSHAGMLAALKAAVYIHSFTADELARESYVVLPSKLSEYLPHVMHKVTLHKYEH